MKKNYFFLFLLTLISITALVSCKKDPAPPSIQTVGLPDSSVEFLYDNVGYAKTDDYYVSVEYDYFPNSTTQYI